jgi:hypothetical protein
VSTIARLERADLVISDARLDAQARAILRAEVGELVLAGPEEAVGDLTGRAARVTLEA